MLGHKIDILTSWFVHLCSAKPKSTQKLYLSKSDIVLKCYFGNSESYPYK